MPKDPFYENRRFSGTPLYIYSDKRLTLNMLRVLGALYGSRKSGTKITRMSRKRISVETGGLPLSKISTATTKLQKLGFLKKLGNGGKGQYCTYELFSFSEYQAALFGSQESNRNVQPNDYQNESKMVPDSVTQMVPVVVPPIDTEIYTDKNTDSEIACEKFIRAYPIKTHEKEIRNNWNKFNKDSRVKVISIASLRTLRKSLEMIGVGVTIEFQVR